VVRTKYVTALTQRIPPRNEMGWIHYVKYDPRNNFKPIYRIGFENLKVENKRFGIFRTPAAKSVRIRNLGIKGFRYSAALSDASCSAPQATTKECRPIDTSKTPISVVADMVNRKGKWSIDIDLSNVTRTEIFGFEYSLVGDCKLLLGVQSRRAIITSDWPCITLRGHAVIAFSDGSSLEGNCVVWDTEKGSFEAKGIYVIKRNGFTTVGNNITVSGQSNSVVARNVTVGLLGG